MLIEEEQEVNEKHILEGSGSPPAPNAHYMTMRRWVDICHHMARICQMREVKDKMLDDSGPRAVEVSKDGRSLEGGMWKVGFCKRSWQFGKMDCWVCRLD